ncbi:sterol carrier family protein [Rhodobacteraceae bacterium 2CG4]|uniref:Sterol carrier family protein n=1 Tax=Halovulum marinum TaxID=2662447 RepID=A0A6L5YZH7_9RHOB|nr:SCP2 sterol-binding domain-containing protein [Halovulum marinum]MSU89706.1 sterol carrier family protein [Halovulum marinum]
MSDTLNAAIEALRRKVDTDQVDFSAKFVIEDEGAIRLDQSGVREDDSDADVVMTADAETFRGILEGDVNPTSAFMSGQLSVDGDMGLAMKLGSILS